jgi:hypothetical protein
MGIGPAPAGRAALKAAGLELKDMDICEVSLFQLINTKFFGHFIPALHNIPKYIWLG